MGIFYARNWLSDRRKSRFSDGLWGGGMAYESKHSIYKAVDFLVVCPDAAQRVYDHCLCDTITGFFQISEWRKNGIGIYGGGEMMF